MQVACAEVRGMGVSSSPAVCAQGMSWEQAEPRCQEGWWVHGRDCQLQENP